ncbi:hypothetical protein [Streptomyces catenulae]|uniref:Lipoprotein n=1 Tax=Streptomyces catenulae TaxID=66875 RepID=A0ABV2Z4S2_9ACTN|nr:hypothetical protein [Streptomyces catenulae]
MGIRSVPRGRRRFTAALLATVLGAASLTACGGGSGGAGAKDTAGGAFPRTIRTAMAEVTVPSKPKRVVVPDTGELDDVTLLGVDPVGAVSPHMRTEGGFPTYLKPEIGGVTDAGPLPEPGLEKKADAAMASYRERAHHLGEAIRRKNHGTLVLVTVADVPEKTRREDVTSNPVRKSLPAVKHGKVFEVPDETWMSGIGIQAAEHMFADVAKAAGVPLPAK